MKNSNEKSNPRVVQVLAQAYKSVFTRINCLFQEKVDVLTTIQKPGALLQVKLVNLLPFNVVMTSHEQKVITKEHIATHTNSVLWFNPLNAQIL